MKAQIGFPKTKEHIVSPSQLGTYGTPENKDEGCPRWWGYEYIEGLRKPPTVAAKKGTAVHKQLENYFRGEAEIENSDIGKLAKMALPHYPEVVEIREKYGAHKDVELKFGLRVEDVWYRGVIDLPWSDPDGVPVIADHKTSGNPEEFGLKPHQFLTDPQALVYALWATEFTGSPIVRLQWTYIATRGKQRSYPVRAEVHRTEVEKNFHRLIHPKGLEIVQAKRTIRKAEDLPMNTKACGNYGGCPHAAYCPRTKLDVIAAVFGRKKKGKKKMGLLNKMRKKSPPRPEEIKAKGNVVDMPGRRVNSPEAPDDPEVARVISEEVGAISQKPHDDASKQVADAAQGAETPEQAREQIQNALAEGTDFDPKASLNRDQILKLTRAGSNRFAASRDLATVETPFAHGRTLNKMVEDGLITYERDGKFSVVELAVEASKVEMKENGISERALLEKIRGYKPGYTDKQQDVYVTLLAHTQSAAKADALFVEYMRTFT